MRAKIVKGSRYGVTVVLYGYYFYVEFNLHETSIALFTTYAQGSLATLQWMKYINQGKEENTLRIINILSTFVSLLKQKTCQTMSIGIEKHEKQARGICNILRSIYVKISKCAKVMERVSWISWISISLKSIFFSPSWLKY